MPRKTTPKALPAVLEDISDPKTRVTRDNLGRFVVGVVANPKGRALGSKNRASVVRAFIEEALLNDFADEAMALLRDAVKLAKEAADEHVRAQMLKFLLGDLLKEARKTSPDEDDNLNKRIAQAVQINVTHYHGPTQAVPPVTEAPLDGEFTPIEV